MNKETILSRQILTYMLSLTFIIIAIAVVGSYLFYSFLIDYLPGGAVSGSEDDMTFLDWLWIMIASVTSLVVSLFFTVKLSARILTPLNAVAQSLKQISQGNLGARASGTSSQLGETNNLVNDFNEICGTRPSLTNSELPSLFCAEGFRGWSKGCLSQSPRYSETC